jgi:hypothetical protein
VAVTREWLLAWAGRYPVSYDTRHGIAAIAGRTPTFTDVRRAVRWKSARSIGYFDRNRRANVSSIVASALATPDADHALQLVSQLRGVRERVGSAILAVFDPDRYTVMDRRAYATLVATGELPDLAGHTWAETWRPYLATCHAIARRECLDLRAVDRALYAANGRTSLPTPNAG